MYAMPTICTSDLSLFSQILRFQVSALFALNEYSCGRTNDHLNVLYMHWHVCTLWVLLFHFASKKTRRKDMHKGLGIFWYQTISCTIFIVKGHDFVFLSQECWFKTLHWRKISLSKMDLFGNHNSKRCQFWCVCGTSIVLNRYAIYVKCLAWILLCLLHRTLAFYIL